MSKLIATVIILYAIIMHAAFATDRDLTFFKEINQATQNPGLNSDPIASTDRDLKFFKEINQAPQDPGLNSDPIDGASNTEFDVSDYNATVNVSTGSKLNVRNGPGTTHAIIGARYRGDTVRVTHNDGQWRKIAWSAGQIAYVHGNYLQSGSLDAAPPDSSSENNTAGTSISTLSDSELQERIDNWQGTDNDPILDRLVSERNARLDVPTPTSGSGGGSRSSGSFEDNTTSTSISALSDSELKDRIDNWPGTDNDPILDRLVSERNARLDVSTPTSGSGGGSRSSGSFEDNTAGTSISTLSDNELQQRIDNWQGSDNDPIFDRLVSERNARLNAPELTTNMGLPIDTSGIYNDILTGQGSNLDLDEVDTRNDGEDNIIVQSIYDPVVSGKETIVDEYSVLVDFPPGMTPQEFLRQMAGDLDGVIPEVREHGDYRNQDDEISVGVISEIDINEGPLPLPDFIDESAINAPVVMTEYDPDSHFIFQTIEHNGNEHPLHGSREFGYEVQDDGKIRIYTRAVSIPDILGAEIAGLKPERDMWSDFVSGIENYVNENSGRVYSRNITQDWGPTGDELWDLLPRKEQVAIKDSQIASIQREIDRLNFEHDRSGTGPGDSYDPYWDLREQLWEWEQKEINGT